MTWPTPIVQNTLLYTNIERFTAPERVVIRRENKHDETPSGEANLPQAATRETLDEIVTVTAERRLEKDDALIDPIRSMQDHRSHDLYDR